MRAALAPAVPLARLAVLRPVLYLFVLYDMAFLVNDVVPHGYVPEDLYKPLLLRRLLDLPVPNPTYVHALQAVLVVACLVAAAGRLPRLAGLVVAVGFLDWVSIGMSYSKIDHDHFSLVVALFAMATVGRARTRDTARSEAAGWALLAVQVACVASYFLSAWAKMRFGGWGWANGAVFAWAMTRRGTMIGDLLLDPPWLLRAGQWAVLVAEFLSPVLLVLRGRARLAVVMFFVLFHAATWATIEIHFLPLVVCLLAFVPLELLLPARRRAAVLAGLHGQDPPERVAVSA